MRRLTQCSEPFPVVILGFLQCPAVLSKLGMGVGFPTPSSFLSPSHFFPPVAILSIFWAAWNEGIKSQHLLSQSRSGPVSPPTSDF